MADALRARQHRIEELRRLKRVRVAPADHLEPFHRVARRVLDARNIDAANLLISRERLRDTLDRVASPINTTCERPLKQLHWPQINRLKLSHADPRMWRALVMSFAPPRVSAKSFSQNAIEASWSSPPSPCASKDSPVVSTMKVEVLRSNL